MEIEKKRINIEQLSTESGVDLSKFKFDYHLETMEFIGLSGADLTKVKEAIKVHEPVFPKRYTVNEKLDKIIEHLGIVL